MPKSMHSHVLAHVFRFTCMRPLLLAKPTSPCPGVARRLGCKLSTGGQVPSWRHTKLSPSTPLSTRRTIIDDSCYWFKPSLGSALAVCSVTKLGSKDGPE